MFLKLSKSPVSGLACMTFLYSFKVKWLSEIVENVEICSIRFSKGVLVRIFWSDSYGWFRWNLYANEFLDFQILDPGGAWFSSYGHLHSTFAPAQ